MHRLSSLYSSLCVHRRQRMVRRNTPLACVFSQLIPTVPLLWHTHAIVAHYSTCMVLPIQRTATPSLPPLHPNIYQHTNRAQCDLIQQVLLTSLILNQNKRKRQLVFTQATIPPLTQRIQAEPVLVLSKSIKSFRVFNRPQFSSPLD